MFRVALYRVLLKFNVHPVQKIKSEEINGEFFSPPPKAFLIPNSEIYSYTILRNGYYPFSGSYVSFGDFNPNWHKNYIDNLESKFNNLDWWAISDFDSTLGDIKTVWELSRFDWVVQLAICSVSGDGHSINLLNSRLNDWIKENPYYKGVNWKCGQEASIRVMHLILAALILNQSNNSSKPLISLIESHIKRIAPTISYAIAQNNNHGTSEAAALYLGGHFLVANGLGAYIKYENLGKSLLEDRASKLFSNDGCFSQYSVNYHRLALDTFTFCETYRNFNNLKSFSSKLNNKIKKATHWLETLTDPINGDVPNLGANDGAQLFKMFNYGYRDFRQSVQWANLVFNDRLIYSITENQVRLFKHLKLNMESVKKDSPIQDALVLGNDDGFFIYKNKSLLLVFRRPVYRFRPSHSDALHIDFWKNGVNILRDGGSYSYNTTLKKSNYYNGIESHNSIQFDFRDQMPKLSRFLFGSWLKENCFDIKETEVDLSIKSGYIDYKGVKHFRTLNLNDKELIISDEISGNVNSAKLRFRLFSANWRLVESKRKDTIEIDVKSKIVVGDALIVNDLESKYYLTETNISVVSKQVERYRFFKTTIKY